MIKLSDLEDAVISSPAWSYCFAYFVKGANIKRLENAVMSSSEWSYYFAYNIKGANIDRLMDVANKDQYLAKRFAKLDREYIRPGSSGW